MDITRELNKESLMYSYTIYTTSVKNEGSKLNIFIFFFLSFLIFIFFLIYFPLFLFLELRLGLE